MIYKGLDPGPKWSLAKRFVRAIVNAFEWGDYEYSLFTFSLGPWPLRFWLTAYHRRSRLSWHRRLFPWRLRTALATVLWDATYRRCTRCSNGFTLRELLKRDGLTFFQSGSVCHNNCEPSEDFNRIIQEMQWKGEK